ncbi:hypothetical protein RHMOL_Rhmol10G0198200 [Rhododendron molle]|uniref:Uncharacterized protein n=1 Tax=Rhododendron molle TaxID=49168 RepID=A0ACC0M5E4_RHOML|nr:hypothetical protein RHMOL_Rhmol10G0198200 [Rhododendron molle]
MADDGMISGSGEVVDHPRDEGASMEPTIGDQTATGETAVVSAVALDGGEGGANQQQEVGDEENPHATEENPRATVPTGAVGSISEAGGLGVEVEGPAMIGGSSGSGGAMGDDPGPNEFPPRDPTKGKSTVIVEEENPIEEEQTTEEPPIEIREQDIAFRPPASAATSSRHVPITFDEIAEHTPNEILARLLEERPDIGEYVLKAKEERARAVEAGVAAEKAERKRKDREEPLRDMEAEERVAEEAIGPRVTAVAEAAEVRRPDYTSETYTPPTPHLFVPSGFSAYTPQRLEYDDETVLRDPLIHIANTWAEVTTEREAEQMARAYLLYLFGATLYPNRRSRVHLSYLPALRDLRTASRFDWGGAALATAYTFLGNSSRTGKSTAGYWRIWELWAYEVLRMYPPQCKHPDLSTLPRALIWSKKYMGLKEGRGNLDAYRLYLDELRASQVNWNPWRVAGAEPTYLARSRAITASRVLLESAFGWQWYLGDRVTRQSLGYTAFQVPGPLPPRASHTSTYTQAELEGFTQPDTELRRFLRPEMDYAEYQRDHLARPLGIRAFRDVRSQAHGAGEERRAAGERARGGEGRVRLHAGVPVRGGPPEMSWVVPVTDAQGNLAEIHLVPARVDPPPVTVPAPAEWVNEAVRRMLALENLVRRVAGGFQLELRYPAPTAPQAQRAAGKKPQGQGHATSRSKRTRTPPQKQLAVRTPIPTATPQRQTRSSQAAAARKEPARQAAARAEEQFRIAVRKRPSSEEQRAQKRPRLVMLPTSEDEEDDEDEEEDDEEGEEEEHSSARSDSDDSVDDPAYEEDPKDGADDDDDGSDDDGGRTGLKDWLGGED